MCLFVFVCFTQLYEWFVLLFILFYNLYKIESKPKSPNHPAYNIMCICNYTCIIYTLCLHIQCPFYPILKFYTYTCIFISLLQWTYLLYIFFYTIKYGNGICVCVIIYDRHQYFIYVFTLVHFHSLFKNRALAIAIPLCCFVFFFIVITHSHIITYNVNHV